MYLYLYSECFGTFNHSFGTVIHYFVKSLHFRAISFTKNLKDIVTALQVWKGRDILQRLRPLGMRNIMT